MAQNVSIAGASYSNVPAVDIPKTGGGTARFVDTSDADASSSDIFQGRTAYVNGQKLVGTGAGAKPEQSKTATANGTVYPDSGKVLSSVVVNVPLPSGSKWYGFRSWTSAVMGANLALKNENWTNNEGTTGISVGDVIILEVTTTDTNKVYAFLVLVKSMSGITAVGDAFAAVEIGSTMAPVNPVTTYDGSVSG